MTSDAWEADAMGEQLSAVTPSIPTLVVWGRDDRLLPVEDAYELQRSLPGSYLAVVEDAEHDADLDRPEVVHRLMAAALAGRLEEHRDDAVLVTGP
jgi:pimeloyl-ACP methyl ester carboxylesterase